MLGAAQRQRGVRDRRHAHASGGVERSQLQDRAQLLDVAGTAGGLLHLQPGLERGERSDVRRHPERALTRCHDRDSRPDL